MNFESNIYVAVHCGLVGSALMCNLHGKVFNRLIACTHVRLDIANPVTAVAFFAQVQHDYILLAAALANNTFSSMYALGWHAHTSLQDGFLARAYADFLNSHVAAVSC